jgi:predicted porin
MKKELLIASALTASFGLAGVAEAATASFSGNVRNGVTGSDLDDTTTASHSSSQQASLTFSVSETTDAGTKMSTGFNIMDENTSDVGAGSASGLTLTFTDGSTLALIEAGNAATGRIASVPGASGEQGITGVASSANAAPGAITWGSSSDNVGFTYTSAADALGVEGLTYGVSAAFGDDGDASASSNAETSYSVGATYVTTTGDTTVTIGGGFIQAGDSNTTTVNDKADVMMVSATAVTGNLTIGVGYGAGSRVNQDATEVDGASIMTLGAKYVSGDMTMSVGMKDAEAKDGAAGSDGTNTDTLESIGGSVDYAVASGVTATIGYTDVSAGNEGSSVPGNSGSAWYIGANISF